MSKSESVSVTSEICTDTPTDLVLLVALEFSNYLYEKYLKSVNVVNLDYVVTEANVSGDEINLSLDLNNSLKLKSDDYIILNPQINIKVPVKVFPLKQDFIGFEYEVISLNQKTKEIQKDTVIIRVQLFDTILSPQIKSKEFMTDLREPDDING